MIILILLAFLLSPVSAWAACGGTGNNLTATTAADVNECSTTASGLTGVVTITLSSADWDGGTATLDMSTGYANVTKLIITGGSCTLDVEPTGACADQGQGVCPSACSVVMTDTRFNVTVKYGIQFEMKNLQIEGTHITVIYGNNVASNNTDYSGWRIHHMYYNEAVTPDASNLQQLILSQPSGVKSQQWGLVDHVNVNGLNQQRVLMGDANTSDYGNYEWSLPLALGSKKALYFEDNYVHDSDGATAYVAVDIEGGRTAVIRKNNLYNISAVSAHDTCTGGAKRGVKAVEIYKNRLGIAANMNNYIAARGTSGVIYQNTVYSGTPASNYFIAWSMYRDGHLSGYCSFWGDTCTATPNLACVASDDTAAVTCSPEGDNTEDCGTNGKCAKVDGLEDNPDGWPCRDQIGVAQLSTGAQVGGANPALVWGNTLGSYVNNLQGVADNAAPWIVADRDFCATANGTTSDTYPDSSTCGTATIANYWTGPYTYPHPLQGGDDGTPPVLSALAPYGGMQPCLAARTVTLSLTTDEAATCKFGTVFNQAYADMGTTFGTTGTTSHSHTYSVNCGQTYDLWVRCSDGTNPTTTSKEIWFTVDSRVQIGGGTIPVGGGTIQLGGN